MTRVLASQQGSQQGELSAIATIALAALWIEQPRPEQANSANAESGELFQQIDAERQRSDEYGAFRVESHDAR